MIDHIRSAFCRNAARWLSRAAGQPLSLIGSSCRHCRLALSLLSQLASPGASLCASYSDPRGIRPKNCTFLRFNRITVGTPTESAIALLGLPWSPSGAELFLSRSVDSACCGTAQSARLHVERAQRELATDVSQESSTTETTKSLSAGGLQLPERLLGCFR